MKYLNFVFSVTLIVVFVSSTNPCSAAGFIAADQAETDSRAAEPTSTLASSSMPVPALRRPIMRRWALFPNGGVRLQSEKIDATIQQQVAKTYIKQVFFNDSDVQASGTYLFPLPEDTAYSSYSLHIDGKVVEGQILEAGEARRQYEQIVRQMADPGLLEYSDSKTVRARIFPIPPHGTKTVELEYTQLLKSDQGLVKYKFPLKAEGSTTTGSIEQVSLDAKISSTQGLRTIWSPTHEIKTLRSDDHHAKVEFHASNVKPDKDFVLYLSLSNKGVTADLLTHKDKDEEGYFLLALSPTVSSLPAIAKDVVVAIDTSGSMSGKKIEQAQSAIKYIVNALDKNDRFALVQFSTDVDFYKSAMELASSDNKRDAVRYVDKLEARGGTNIGAALTKSMALLNESHGRPGYLVFVTDGLPTAGVTNTAKLLSLVPQNSNVRLFDFGVGYDVDTSLLNKLSVRHHGTSQYVEPDEDLENALSTFYGKIKSPVLTDVKMEFHGVEPKKMYPSELTDIFAGEQEVILGRYPRGGKTTLTLRGKVNGAPKEYSYSLSFSADETANTFLPRLWAMRRIGYLTDIAAENSNNKEVVDEIVELSKKYGIISKFTSFLVMDPAEARRLSARGPASAFQMSSINPTGGARFQFAPNRPQAHAYASSIGKVEGPRDMNMFQVSPTVIDERHYTGHSSGQLQQQASPALSPVAAAGPAQALFGSPAALGGQALVPLNVAAVQQSKANSQLKEASSMSAGPSQGTKVVENKTFYLRNEIWTESTFTDGAKTKKVSFGSDEYFALVKSKPAMAKYLAVGQQVIFSFENQWYQITEGNKGS